MLNFLEYSLINIMNIGILSFICAQKMFFSWLVFQVLFVSPERFLNADFLSIFSATIFVSLVVVDEAHCVSEW